MADSSQQSFLNSLFQWTVKNTAENPAPTTTDDRTHAMNEEKKKWLDEALENLTVNPVGRMKLCISKIKDEQLSEQEKKEFLEELGHWAEELDLAKDFFTIGGLDILEPLLDHPNEAFVTQTCSLIANLVQNNDHCQRIIVQSGLQQKLLQIVDQSNNPDVKTKAVTAISALIRGYTLGQLQLQKYHGAKVLIRALSTPFPRLQNKLCFLINTICSSSAQMKKLFYENGALEALTGLSVDESCPDFQHALETVMTLASANENALMALAEREPALIERFEAKLNERRQLIQGSEDDLNEMTVINRIQAGLRSPTSESDTVVPPVDQQIMAVASS